MKMQEDLFGHTESLPKRVQKVLSKYEDSDLSYKKCEKFLKEIECVGYTFDYYLDAQPFNLRRIENKVILIGKFQGIGAYRGEESEQFVSFDILVEQTRLGNFGLEEEQISRFRIASYGENARFVKEKISIGQEIRIEGKLINNSYLDANGNVVLTTLIESSLVDLLEI